MNEIATGLLSFIHTSTSPFHTVRTGAAMLAAAGFCELSLHEPWTLTRGGAYYIRFFDSTLLAFTLGDHPRDHLRIAAAHTDFPALRIKPQATLHTPDYDTLNVEIYGGLMRESWLDRPLSFAGKVVLQGEQVFTPQVQLIDYKKPVFIIPRLAIHLNRNVNDGLPLNPQKDMLPLLSLSDEKPSSFTDFLAAYMQIEPSRLLAYDLTVYPCEEGCLLGMHQELLSAPRLDNLTSAYACLMGMIDSHPADGLNMIALFDNEEVGSRTKQGAASQALPRILHSIYRTLQYTEEEYRCDMADAFLLSVDVAHALHPNIPEKCDPSHRPVMGNGPALKTACSQAYVGDAEALGMIKGLCRKYQIPHQHFVNRNDVPGGSTLGSILSAGLSVRGLDVGIPILAMHSARETMGIADQERLQQLLTCYFQDRNQ